ncbi:hypothetical protein HD595_003710 [Nonomuraea roseoviolacea subsp. carminata]|uniref:Uncharacterized protein n=1 Tax=Nonomuraea roseoviolacea subsp. carminata TaxID=160689 RepID=A0ABT1K0R3_9ACTN|nr:hypothetical protein [Nonomuraea roseoviolacea subsp. carminata]
MDRTLDLLVAAHEAPSTELHETEAIKRQMAECDRKPARHRAALGARADPVLIASWMREEQGRKTELQHRLTRLPGARPRLLDRDSLAASLRGLGSLVEVLGRADPTRKAKIYANLCLELVHHPSQHKVLVAVSSDQDHMGYGSVSEGRLSPAAHGQALFLS